MGSSWKHVHIKLFILIELLEQQKTSKTMLITKLKIHFNIKNKDDVSLNIWKQAMDILSSDYNKTEDPKIITYKTQLYSFY